MEATWTHLMTAASIMSPDFIQVDDTATVEVVSKRLRAYEKRTGRPPAILVLRQGRLVGCLPAYELGLRKPLEKIHRYVREMAVVGPNAKQREIVATFRGHPHDKVAVVDEDGSVLGIIYSDDLLRLLHEHSARALFSFAGVKDEENVHDSATSKVRHRFKWLLVNLGTAFLAAFTVSLFKETISQVVILAFYMPIVAGMGGNAGTQTLAVLVRGIALKQIELRSAVKALTNEVLAGSINGLLNGLLVGFVVYLLHHDIRLSLVLSCAMVINLTVAGFFGTLVPLIMRRLGKDPATSATIFITTATDVLGFLSFLGLATVLLT